MMLNKNDEIKKAHRKRKLTLLSAGLALVVSAAVVLSLIFIKNAQSNVLYYTIEKLFFYDANDGARELYDHNIDSMYMYRKAALSKDGKRVFYYLGRNLYCSELESSDYKTEEIAKNVSKLYLNESGERGAIEQLKDEGGARLLYWTKKDGLIEIENEFVDLSVSKNLKSVYFSKRSEAEGQTTSDIYLFKNEKDIELIVEGVTEWKLNENGTTLYFVRDGGLFEKKRDRDEVQISHGDAGISILRVYDSGIYYKIKSPYEAEYYTGQGRLAFYDGKKEHIISELEEDYFEIVSAAKDRPVIFYASADAPMLDNGEPWVPKLFVAVGGEVNEVSDNIIAYSTRLTDDGKRMYFVERGEDLSDETGDMYYVDIIGKKMGSPKLYDTDVYGSDITLTSNGDLYYFKNYKAIHNYDKRKGDLYMNKKYIDTNVLVVRTEYFERNKLLAYLTEADDGKVELCRSIKGKEGETIGQDVADYTITQNGDIIFTVGIKKALKKLYINSQTASPIAEMVDGIIKIAQQTSDGYVVI